MEGTAPGSKHSPLVTSVLLPLLEAQEMVLSSLVEVSGSGSVIGFPLEI